MHTIVHDPHIDDPEYLNFDYAETCPECGKEVYIHRDPKDKSFSVVCPYCGKKLMLCSLCIDTFGECSRKNGKCICEQVMTFSLYTTDLQLLHILLMLRDRKKDLCPDDTKRLDRIESLVDQIEDLCNERNDYTVNVTVSPANT